MANPYAGEGAPIRVQDLARPQAMGWLSHKDAQYVPSRQAQPRRRALDRRRGKRGASSGAR